MSRYTAAASDPRNGIMASMKSLPGERVNRGGDRMKPVGPRCCTTIDEGLGSHYTRKQVGLPPTLSLFLHRFTPITAFPRIPGREFQHAELHRSADSTQVYR